jgi:hypothetical protein
MPPYCCWYPPSERFGEDGWSSERERICGPLAINFDPDVLGSKLEDLVGILKEPSKAFIKIQGVSNHLQRQGNTQAEALWPGGKG